MGVMGKVSTSRAEIALIYAFGTVNSFSHTRVHSVEVSKRGETRFYSRPEVL